MLSLVRRFAVVRSTPVLGQRFPYPVDPCPSIGVFLRHFVGAPPVLTMEDVRELEESNAESVAAPLSLLRTINTDYWRPEFPMIVLSRVDRGLLGEADRDFLWDRFRVPVFEYLMDASGTIVARECEAHDGLHVESGVQNLRGPRIRDGCGCGRSTPRLVELKDIIEGSTGLSMPGQEWRNWQTHQTQNLAD